MPTFTGEEVLKLLARYRVSVPVGILYDLGIVQSGRDYSSEQPVDLGMTRPAPRRTRPRLSYAGMERLAKRNKHVRWTFSGIVERLRWDDLRQRIWAAGVHTVPHVLDGRLMYDCEPVSQNCKKTGDPGRVSRWILHPSVHESLYGHSLPHFISMRVTPTVAGGVFGDHRGHACHIDDRLNAEKWGIWCLTCQMSIGVYGSEQLEPLTSKEAP